MARRAVGAVNMTVTRCSATTAAKAPGVRRPHRLALVQDRRRPGQQRSVHDVGVADDPADVARREHHVALADVVDGPHRVGQRDRVPALIADDALRLPRGAGGVEDVERIGRRHLDAGRRFEQTGFHDHRPVQVATLDQVRGQLRPLQDDAVVGLVPRPVEGGVEHRLVRDHLAGLQPAGGGDDHLRSGVVDARGELGRGEAAEHHRVHGSDPGAGQHGDRRLGHHRQVDHHPITGGHAELTQGSAEPRHLVQQPGIAVGPPLTGDGGVEDQSGHVGPPGDHVPVERVVAGVQGGVGIPAVQRRRRRSRGSASACGSS